MTKWTQKTLKHAEGDKATASLNSEIEAVNLRGNSNFYSRLVFQFSISSGILPPPPFLSFPAERARPKYMSAVSTYYEKGF